MLAVHETNEWPSIEKKEVLLLFDNWTRYKLNSTQEWAALYPGDGVVHLGTAHEPYTVAMLHELRCLDMVRHALTLPRAARDMALAARCMNYLRQALMCRGDTQLDPYQYTHAVRAVQTDVIRRCHDWRAVYDRVKEIQQGER
ncbi:hypothetical protein PsYK624_085080 [Phanerochaete sordida]|uniref:Uncharacterized protein n=1 Tax=Phanerochaete sordida TaxID=48140 RepID=A0A9P3GDI2_9APHY|nr:hypothetical protein PsYK624_085080 [Phanerochaete sordida]